MKSYFLDISCFFSFFCYNTYAKYWKEFSGEGFITGEGFGNLESRDTILLRSVALNLQNPVNETKIDVKKDI